MASTEDLLGTVVAGVVAVKLLQTIPGEKPRKRKKKKKGRKNNPSVLGQRLFQN